VTAVGLAALWAGAGVAVTVLVRLLRLRRFGGLLPAALGAGSLAVVSSPISAGPFAGGGAELSRAGLGLLVAAGLAIAAAHLLDSVSDGLEPLVTGVAGGAVVLILAAHSELLYGAAALLASGVIGVRWITVHPGRATLAAGRIPTLGAATLIAAAPFLPVAGEAIGPRASLAGGLVLVGVVGLVAMLPAGGWAAGSAGGVRAGEFAVWLLLVAPSVLLTASGVSPDLPLAGRLTFEHGMLVIGLLSAVWGGLQSARSVAAGSAYVRVAIADLALFAAGIGSTQAVARSGGLLLVLTHLTVGPLLLQRPSAALSRQRRLAWVALSGIPPSPAFWGRFLVLEGCIAANNQAGLLCVVALGLLFLSAVLALVRGETSDDPPAVGTLSQIVAWGIAGAGIALGLAPGAIARAVFGGL